MTSVLRDLKNKITGADKYQHNLLGESLPDLLRRATAKTLVTPDEEINQQVSKEARSGPTTTHGASGFFSAHQRDGAFWTSDSTRQCLQHPALIGIAGGQLGI